MEVGARTAALLVLALIAAGCEPIRSRFPLVAQATESLYTANELRDALADWADSFEARVAVACDRIRGATRERDARRSCLLWQIRMVPLAKEAAFRSNPQESYVAALALATAQHVYLASGEGAALFGPQQPIGIEAAQQIEAGALAIGQSFLTQRQLGQLDAEVDRLVQGYPIQGVFSPNAFVTGFSQASAGRVFAWVVNLPMVPFRALGGVSDTAQAVQEFNVTAQEFTGAVAQLPPLTRWQLELLLYDAEELESVDRALRAAESFADGAERMSDAAAALPAGLGAELAARLEEARGTIAELDAVLERIEGLAGPLTHVSDRLGDASAQWTSLLADRQPDGAVEAEGRSFDVREYEAAAGRIAEASGQIRALVAELNALDGSRLSAVTDRVFWQAALLIGFFFAALATYRIALAHLR